MKKIIVIIALAIGLSGCYPTKGQPVDNCKALYPAPCSGEVKVDWGPLGR